MERLQELAEGYLRRNCTRALDHLLLSPELDAHHALPINFLHLADVQLELAKAVLVAPMLTLEVLDQALNNVQCCEAEAASQRNGGAQVQVKEHAHVRIHSLPCELWPAGQLSMCHPTIGDVCAAHIGKLITVSGTAVRVGAVKMFEYKKCFECSRCHHRISLPCSLEQGGGVTLPESCTRPDRPCSGNNFKLVSDPEEQRFTSYQEVKVQEKMQCLDMGSTPSTLSVLLLHELADSIKPGDDVQVTGVVMPRWEGVNKPGQRCSAELLLAAHNTAVTTKNGTGGAAAAGEVTPELAAMFEGFWSEQQDAPLRARNKILAAICPQLHGMFLVKLATMLTLAGGVRRTEGGTSIRGDVHMLLIGDPGIGKSQIMKFAARVSHRSVVTTGRGSSAAGITVTAVKDGAAWVLEAGALVLADGGVCCIDEFDGIKDGDKAMLHEAMEQQTLHVAKAGMVTTLSTRTTIIAATNPKPRWTPLRPLSEATSIAGPLLSRFDVLLVMTDARNKEWDRAVAHHVLQGHQSRGNQVTNPGGRPASAPASKSATSMSGGQGWTIEVLQQYVLWVKSQFNPVMSPEAEAVILAYYHALRGSDDRSASRTTVRMLESLVRLSQAHARLMARHEVTQDDALVAVTVVEASCNCLMVIGPDSAMYASFAEDPDTEHHLLSQRLLRELGLPWQAPLPLPAPPPSSTMPHMPGPSLGGAPTLQQSRLPASQGWGAQAYRPCSSGPQVQEGQRPGSAGGAATGSSGGSLGGGLGGTQHMLSQQRTLSQQQQQQQRQHPSQPRSQHTQHQGPSQGQTAVQGQRKAPEPWLAPRMDRVYQGTQVRST